MPKAKKLPSGSYRAQAYERTENGKKIYRSFTAPTKREAEYLASEYMSGRKKDVADITVREAMENYIASKEGVLSPTTVTSYNEILKNRFDGIAGVSLKDIDQIGIQAWVGALSKRGLGAKTVANAHGLLAAVLGVYLPDMKLKTKMPPKKKPSLYIPIDEEVTKVVQHAKGTELEVAILLGAFGPMRRSEICALTSSDINGCLVSVNKAMVRGVDGKGWVVKDYPKTFDGFRDILYPQFVIDRIKGIEGRVYGNNPDTITNNFRRSLIRCGCRHFRFHDLRHYAASIMHSMNVPEAYIMKRGGWGDANTLRKIYRHTMDEKERESNAAINAYFEKVSHGD
jgi:integrase